MRHGRIPSSNPCLLSPPSTITHAPRVPERLLHAHVSTAPPEDGRRRCFPPPCTVVRQFRQKREHPPDPTQRDCVAVLFTKANTAQRYHPVQICIRSRVRNPAAAIIFANSTSRPRAHSSATAVAQSAAARASSSPRQRQLCPGPPVSDSRRGTARGSGNSRSSFSHRITIGSLQSQSSPCQSFELSEIAE